MVMVGTIYEADKLLGEGGKRVERVRIVDDVTDKAGCCRQNRNNRVS